MQHWLIGCVTLGFVVGLLAAQAAAADSTVTHALAMHGTPKYGPDFGHFDYVNPDAPKGGTIRLAAQGTFDSFHPFIPKGNPGIGGSYFESLLTSSADEPFTEYGLLAASIEVPADRSWVTFTLRPEARWHDGKPISVEDVIWSLQVLKSKGRPFFRFYYAGVSGAEKVGERQVKFTFSEHGNRELPLIVGQMPVLPKHYWEARDFTRTTLEPPLTSGPYRVAAFEAGRYVQQERVKTYWGKDLPVNKGQDNFDVIRTDYYRDDTVIRTALKAGDIDYRQENQAKAWALDYDVPAVRKGWLKKEKIPHERPTGMQALIFNTRRPIFQDRTVRRALAYAFDFEWTNKNLFFSQYTRTESYFSNSELAATGLPEGEELTILQRYRDRLPPEVFSTPYQTPRTDGSGRARANIRQAFALLKQAGWEVRKQQLIKVSTGETMQFEILLVSAAFERIVLPFVRNLERLGIKARVRLVDQSQYINRLRSFDFDMFVGGWGQSPSPGNEQRGFWSSAGATSPAARNYAGIQDPIVDELIELLIQAPSRASLVARTRALDRVLLHGHYVIPNWHLRFQRILYWDKFSRPDKPTTFGTSISLWWYDRERAVRLNAARSE
jgi:microcin C transport system substrate-binding protein